MAAHTTPVSGTTDSRDDVPNTARDRPLAMLAGLLGLTMFFVGFLRWLSVGEGDDQSKYSGFAHQMPTTAIIGLSLAAGLIAMLGALAHRRGRSVPSTVPTGLAITSLLLAIGVYLGKGAISPELGDEVGVEIGLILGIVIAAVQSLVLGKILASQHDDHDHLDRR